MVLSPVAPAAGFYETPHQVDPFAVPLEEKLSLLMAATQAMKGPNLKLAQAFASAYVEHQHFASTEGARLEQRIIQCGGGIAATAIDAARHAGPVLPEQFPRQLRHRRLGIRARR